MTREDAFLDQVIPELDRLLGRVRAPADAPRGLLVALSGGADSTALLLAAAAWRDSFGDPLAAVHVNHRLRGAESDRDEVFCAELCLRLDVPFHVRRAEPRDDDSEAGCREKRRRIFAEILDAHPDLAACATAHHLDDQLETLVMRFFRGAGAEGLRGIRPLSGRTIHPLLGVDRERIEAFLTARGQPWRVDPTNLDGTNTRSRVRIELLPLARDIFGAAADTAPPRLAELLTADTAVLETIARGLLAGMLADGDGASLPVADLIDLAPPISSRAVRIYLRDHCGVATDLARVHVDRLLDWLPDSRSGRAIDLIEGWRAYREFDRLIFLDPRRSPPIAPAELEIRPATPEEMAEPDGHEGLMTWRLTLPADALQGEPRLRRWREGDRFVPLGMTGHKKVSDLLREARIPARIRHVQHVVEDDAGPLWLAGVARAERTRMLPSTETAVTLLIRGKTERVESE